MKGVLFLFFYFIGILGEPLRGASPRSRRAIRSITFAGFARSVVPLLSLSLRPKRSGSLKRTAP
jgi:hypothetical protein